MISFSEFEVDRQVNPGGVGMGSVADGGEKGVDQDIPHMEVSSQMATPDMVDIESPVLVENITTRVSNRADFQEQLDDIDAELAIFKNKEGEGNSSGPGLGNSEADQPTMLVGSSAVCFLPFNVGHIQQQEKSKECPG